MSERSVLIARLRDRLRVIDDGGFVDEREVFVDAIDALSQVCPPTEWIDTDERKPDDEQTVLGFWKTVGTYSANSMESLSYHASDSPIDGRESWRSWNGEEADAPDYWMPILKGPK